MRHAMYKSDAILFSNSIIYTVAIRLQDAVKVFQHTGREGPSLLRPS